MCPGCHICYSMWKCRHSWICWIQILRAFTNRLDLLFVCVCIFFSVSDYVAIVVTALKKSSFTYRTLDLFSSSCIALSKKPWDSVATLKINHVIWFLFKSARRHFDKIRQFKSNSTLFMSTYRYQMTFLSSNELNWVQSTVYCCRNSMKLECLSSENFSFLIKQMFRIYFEISLHLNFRDQQYML